MYSTESSSSSNSVQVNSARYLSDPLAEDVPSFISHEIRTPLTSIQGLLKLLQMGKLGLLSEEGKYLLDIAINNTDRLNRLANAIDHQAVLPMTVLSPQEVEQLQLETDLQKALQNRDFQVHYQPIISARMGRIVGFEALARWCHPNKGYIPPTVFIPLLEKPGLIHNLGIWILKQACQQLSSWQQQFPASPPLSMSVNLSASQLLQPDLVSQTEEILLETGIASNSLKLEITESALIHNHRMAITVLSDLKALGIQLYVDDFGTGYSSLARLQDLPVDALKIDRSFIQSKRWDISEAIIDLALRLGLDVIAEGVETFEDRLALQSLGCEHMQGYFFSKPIDSKSAHQLMITSSGFVSPT